MERFAAFSGITRLTAKDLHIFNVNNLFKAPTEGIVGNFIKNGDKVIFDLDYEEFWLEVSVNLFSNNKKLKIEFFLRIQKYDFYENLKQNLISISTCLWNHYIKKQQDFNICEIYLLKNFEIISTVKCSESEGALVKDKLDFDSKIKCNCEFININQYILYNLVDKIKMSYLLKSKLVSDFLFKSSKYFS